MLTDDAELVARCLNGSKDAFDAIMVRYQRLIFRIAVSFTRETEEALDLSQEVFLQTHQKLHLLEQPEKLKAWMVRMTYNHCINWKRSAGPIREELQDVALPEHAYLSLAERSVLERCLARLNPKQKLAVVLKYFEGYSNKELAQVLDITENHAKNLIYRSIRKMAEVPL